MSVPEETMNVTFTVPVIARTNLGSTADISHIFMELENLELHIKL